jgi:hypothetical protein
MKLCVVGCERSGTSAVSKLLSIGSGWSLLDDPSDFWYVTPVIYRTGSGLTFRLWRALRTHDIVKVPRFATILPYLRKRFLGNFSTVYCVRDPRDVVASVRERLRTWYYTDFITDSDWLDVRPGDQVEAVAWKWRKYLESALQYQSRGERIMFIRYEDFFAEKLKTIETCARHMHIPFRPEKAAPHVDRQFKKRWNGGKIAGPLRWREELTEPEASKITRICSDLMREWGYV